VTGCRAQWKVPHFDRLQNERAQFDSTIESSKLTPRPDEGDRALH